MVGNYTLVVNRRNVYADYVENGIEKTINGHSLDYIEKAIIKDIIDTCIKCELYEVAKFMIDKIKVARNVIHFENENKWFFSYQVLEDLGMQNSDEWIEPIDNLCLTEYYLITKN